jgi:hypothetical protein
MIWKCARGISPRLYFNAPWEDVKGETEDTPRKLQFITATLATRNWSLWTYFKSKSANHYIVTIIFQILRSYDRAL